MIARDAEVKVNSYVEEITAAATAKEQAARPQHGSGDQPANQEEPRNATPEVQPTTGS